MAVPRSAREPAGQLDVEFDRQADGRSYLRRQYAAYPYHLCRVHHFAGDPDGMATLYLQSSAGGLYEHDRLAIRVSAAAEAQAHVTTQASTIVHGMERGAAEQQVTIRARRGALVEYLPDPTILFPGARLTSRLSLRVHETATIIACDSYLAHDPAGKGAAFGRLCSDTEVTTDDGETLVRDRFVLDGALFDEALPGLNGPHRVNGTFLVIDRQHPAERIAAALSGALGELPGLYAGASTLPGDCGAWARLQGPDGAAFKVGMEAAWSAVRVLLTGTSPARRRK